MKRLAIIAIILCYSCNAQLTNNPKKGNKMEKFKIDYFNQKKVNDELIETKNDTVIKTAEFKEGFLKYSHAVNSPYENKKIYYKDTFNIKIEADYFYDVQVGIYKVYDENGNVIEEKNYDTIFNFTIAQLINKMSNEFNIDLLDSQGKSVKVIGENGDPVYMVVLLPGTKSASREIKINTSNGQLISDEIIEYRE